MLIYITIYILRVKNRIILDHTVPTKSLRYKIDLKNFENFGKITKRNDLVIGTVLYYAVVVITVSNIRIFYEKVLKCDSGKIPN